jgi:hypothetical protein
MFPAGTGSKSPSYDISGGRKNVLIDIKFRSSLTWNYHIGGQTTAKKWTKKLCSRVGSGI